MKKQILTVITLITAFSCLAATTINPAHNDAYGANIGWVKASGDTANGAVIGEAFCSGYIYSANCGWIHLGDGTPANGQAYANDSATDYGVNHDGQGNLSGFAYGANIGWINFEQTYGHPQIDLLTGIFSGSIYSANTGWISLANAQGYVQTDILASGPDTDGDGIPDAWEQAQVGNLTALSGAGHDKDGDGVPDLDEYRTDTNPDDGNEFLVITDFQPMDTTNEVTWLTQPTRTYRLPTTTNLMTESWINTASGALYDETGSLTIEDIPSTNAPARYYRVRASRPLAE